MKIMVYSAHVIWSKEVITTTDWIFTYIVCKDAGLEWWPYFIKTESL